MGEQEIINAMSDGVIILDATQHIVSVNEPLLRIMACASAHLVGKKPSDLFPNHPAIEPLFDAGSEVVQRIIIGAGPGERHFDLRGNRIWNAQGELAGYLVLLRDMTDHVRTQAEVDRERSRAQEYLDMVSVMIVALNIQGEVTLVNKKGCEILGFDEHEILGRNWIEHFIPPRMRSAVKGISDQLLSGAGEPVEYYENPVLTSDGSERIIAWHNARLLDEGGTIIGVLGSGEDITERVRAEEALRQSEQRYRALVENQREGMATADPEDRFTFTNPATEGIFGVPAGSLVGRSLKEFMTPAEFARVQSETAKRREGEKSRYEVRGVRPDGTERTVLISASPLQDENGQFMGSLGIFRDITEWRDAQDALKDSEERVLTILESIDADIYVADMESYEILFMNQHMLQSFGTDLVGQTCWKELRGGDAPCPHCTNPRLLDEKGRPAGVVVWEGQNPITSQWYMNYDRAIEWVDGRIVRLQIATDITRIKQTEADLRQAKEDAERLYNIVPSGIFTVDTERRITSVNDRALEITGYTEEDLLGNPCTVFAVEPCLARCGLYSEDVAKPISGRECVVQTRDGRRLFVSKNADLIRDVEGKVIGGIESFEDITERKAAEDALVSSNRELERAVARANRLAIEAEKANLAKSEFLANMSHEIRTPMNGIIGMTELALGTKLTHEQRDYLMAVQTSADSLLGLINDILDLSKIEAGRLAIEELDFNLREVIEGIADIMTQRRGDKDIELIFHLDPASPLWVRGDPLRLRQILVNLIGNAIKFTEKGEIVVKVEPATQSDAEIELLCSVSDTGIGIQGDKLDLIFDSFSQADGSITRQYGGTGLGLAISRQLTQLMGGRISVESEVGVGSTFSFTVVMRPGVAQEVESPLGVELLPDLRILIVDDNPTNRQVLRETIQGFGPEPEEVSQGVDALRVLTQSIFENKPFDLVLLDVQMPGLSGLDVLAAIRQMPALNSLGVIMLTSVDGLASLAKRPSLGWSAYLTKPVKQSQLKNAILQAIGHAIPKREKETTKAQRNAFAALRILIVEDNEINRRVATALLERAGHDVIVAENGREAIALLQNEQVELIFMDVQMPEMDGIEATAVIRANPAWANIPIIAMTAHAMEGDRERFLEAGMDDYVTKPIRPDELHQAIQRQARSDAIPQAETEEDGTPVLDRETVIKRLGGDQAIYEELLAYMMDTVQGTLDGLTQAFAGNDPRNVRLLAHSLKGEAATLGAERLRRAAAEVEELGAGGDLGGAECAMSLLRREVDTLRKHLGRDQASRPRS